MLSNEINPYFSKNSMIQKMKNILSLSILFLLLSSTPLFSQSAKKNKMSKADKAFMMQNYYEA